MTTLVSRYLNLMWELVHINTRFHVVKTDYCPMLMKPEKLSVCHYCRDEAALTDFGLKKSYHSKK